MHVFAIDASCLFLDNSQYISFGTTPPSIYSFYRDFKRLTQEASPFSLILISEKDNGYLLQSSNYKFGQVGMVE